MLCLFNWSRVQLFSPLQCLMESFPTNPNKPHQVNILRFISTKQVRCKSTPRCLAASRCHTAVFVCSPQGWFSPGQVFVLDEYCARYGVRGCHRHLCYLSDLLERAENGAMIDPTLLHYSFAFCASHVHGNRYESNHCTHVLCFSLSPQVQF